MSDTLEKVQAIVVEHLGVEKDKLPILQALLMI